MSQLPSTCRQNTDVPFLMTKTLNLKIGPIPASIYQLKVSNRNTRTRCEICSKLTLKTPERRPWLWTCFTPCSSVSVVNLEHMPTGNGCIINASSCSDVVIPYYDHIWWQVCVSFYHAHVSLNKSSFKVRGEIHFSIVFNIEEMHIHRVRVLCLLQSCLIYIQERKK